MGEDFDVVGAGEEEIAFGFLDRPACGEKLGGVALEGVEVTGDVEEIARPSLDGAEESGVESFARGIDEKGGRGVEMGDGMGGILAGVGDVEMVHGEERGVGVGVVFDEVNGVAFGGGEEAEGADAGVDFEEIGAGWDPFEEIGCEVREEGPVGLGEGTGVESDGVVVEELGEMGGAVEMDPLVAEDTVGGLGLDIEVDGVPEIVL